MCHSRIRSKNNIKYHCKHISRVFTLLHKFVLLYQRVSPLTYVECSIGKAEELLLLFKLIISVVESSQFCDRSLLWEFIK